MLASTGLVALPQVASASACSGGTDFRATGDGSVGDPFEISSGTDLIYLSANQSIAGLLAANYLQTANIDLAQCDFVPIGAGSAPFTGSYVGNEKTILGLKVSGSVAELGLFGKLAGSVTKLGIVGGQILGTADRVGLLAGQIVTGASITQSYVTGSVSGDEHVGGLVGDADAGSVTNCWSSASVTGSAAVGGFAGTRNSATLESNYSTGLVTATGAKGGFVGSQVLAMVSVTNNFYNSTTSGMSTSPHGVGLDAQNFIVRANFTGFDFTTPVWKIDANANGGLAYLAWQSVNVSVASTQGREFWVTFDRNARTDGRLDLFISSPDDTTATIFYPDNTNETVALVAGITRTVNVTTKMLTRVNSSSDTIALNALRVTSQRDVSVYSMHFVANTTDASTSVPVSSLGYSYIAIAPVGTVDPINSVGRITVIAVEPGSTTVEITSPVGLTNRAANTPYSVTLTQGQVYTVLATSMVSDITGTALTSNRKISVQTSNFIWSHPLGLTGAADYLYEIMAPISSWGTEIIAARGQRVRDSAPDVGRVVASQDGTQVLRDGVSLANLNKGQFFDFAFARTGVGAHRITANKPIAFLHLTSGSGSYTGLSLPTVSGDPAMSIQPSVEQYLSSYVVSTPSTGFPVNVVTIVARQSDKALVTRGGYAIGATNFVDIPSTSFAVARIAIALGTHYFRAPSGFMLQVAGYNDTDSYAYPGGFGAVNLSEYPGGVSQLEALQAPTKPISVGGDSVAGSPNVCGLLSVSEGGWLDGRSSITSTTYQWFRNGLPVNAANSNTLSLRGFSPGDLVSYEIQKSNILGTTGAFSSPIRVVDNLLTSLETSVGSLTPAFDPCVTTYSVNVIQDRVAITAGAPAEVGLKLGLSGLLTSQPSSTQTLTIGANTRVITASRSGVTQAYTLNINYASGPTVAMQSMTSITATGARLNASVNASGAALSSAEFQYSTQSDFSNSVTVGADFTTATATQIIGKQVAGLVGGQRYFVRARVTNNTGTVTSQAFEFTTLSAPTLANIIVLRDTSVETELDLSATVTSNDSATQLIVRYSLSADFSNSQEQNLGAVLSSGSAQRAGSIAGLPRGVLVYYQLRVTNSHGTNFGPVSQFQMMAKPSFGNPQVFSQSRSAIVEFPVNPHSAVTDLLCISFSLQANVTAACSAATTTTPDIIDGNQFVTARHTFAGLSPSTTYFYQAVARNLPTNGVTYSPTYSFTTTANPDLTSSLTGPISVGPNGTILVTFGFSEAISGFDKTKVLLSGGTTGWTAQPSFEVEPGLYMMEIRPTGTVSAPSTLTISVPSPGTASGGATFPSPNPITVSVVSAPPAISYVGAPFTFTQFQALAPQSVTNAGGVAATFTVSPQLPEGLLISHTGTISGNPVAAQATASYTVTASNAAGSGSTTISIAVGSSNLQAPIISYPLPSYSLKRDVVIAALSPSLGGGATAFISISPALPAGLSLNSSTGVISGTPTTFSTAKNYLVTAVNGAGSNSFALRLGTFEEAPLLTYVQTTLQFPQFAALAPVAPVNAGSSAFFYILSGTLPSGLALNSSTGAITGTPVGTRLSTNAAAVNVTVRASNSGGIQDVVLNLQVVAVAPVVSYVNATVSVGLSLASNSPTISATGGAPTSYSISPALPSGLTMSASGVISGTPTQIPQNPNFVITVSNSAGSTTSNWTLTVNNRTPNYSYAGSPYVANEQQAFTSGTPAVSVGANITFTIAPALPSGLTINSLTGAITGSPAVGTLQVATNYSVTGTNSAGSLTRVISLRVTNLPVMSFSYPSATLNLVESTALTSQFPTVTLGAPNQYSITPSLPAGMSLNASTGEISGTPARGSRHGLLGYLVTGTDGSSSNSFQVAIVILPRPIQFSYPALIMSLEEQLAAPTLAPEITAGSIAPLSFSITPALPAGLVFDTATGIISGTPVLGTEQVATSYTISGLDGNLVETFILEIEIAEQVVLLVTPNPPIAEEGYSGPIVTALSKRLAAAGDSIAAFGSLLASVSYLEIGGIRVEVVELSDTRFAFDLPRGLAPGSYDIIVHSAFGKLTIQKAFEITGIRAANSEGFWTKRVSGERVKVFAKGVVGKGKIQFLVNAQEVSWVRAISLDNPKLLVLIDSDYFLRTHNLMEGKNRFEIRVNGERVWFATYKK